MRCLKRGLREQDAVVRNNPDGVTMEVCKALQDRDRQCAFMGEGNDIQ